MFLYIRTNSLVSFLNILYYSKFINFCYRKLVENSKIDEQKYSNDDQGSDGNLLDVQQYEKGKPNATYYVSFLSY